MADPLSPEEMARLAGTFDEAAEDYEIGRPAYPPEAIEWWRHRHAFDDGTDVLDLAAGTGKLTRLLPLRSCNVAAVEPSANMRSEFRRLVPEVSVSDGTAEEIPFPDDSFDTVVVGQAFHWFDAPRALDEIARVLRPGGGLGLIWNQDDVAAAEWLEDLGERKRAISRSPIAASMRAVAEMADHPWFDAADSTEIRWSETTTVERVVADMRSRSYVVALDERQREIEVARIRRAVEGLGDEFDRPFRSFVLWARHPV